MHNAILLILAALMALGIIVICCCRVWACLYTHVGGISHAENLKGGDDDDKTKS